MAEVNNTIDVLGDDAVIDGIIQGTVTEFKDDKITTLGAYAIAKQSNLRIVDLPAVTTIDQNGISDCPNIEELYLAKVNSIGGSTFANTGSKAKKLVLPEVTILSYGLMTNCRFPTVDCHKLEKISGTCFFCASVMTLILRSEKMCSLDTKPATAFYGSTILNDGGYVYVPKSLLSDDDETKDYRRATNWSEWANKFRALEDYTVDGTVTGDLDESKI